VVDSPEPEILWANKPLGRLRLTELKEMIGMEGYKGY